MTRRAIGDAEVRRLAALLSERFGLRPAREGEPALRMAIRARLEALGSPEPPDYLSRLEAGAEEELRALLPLVTVGWTEFFRDATQFRALRTRLVPELLARARREGRRVRVWSAGCATGEEAYSLAMLADELGVGPRELELLATDVNPAAVERARAGHFPAKRVLGLSRPQLARWFVAHGSDYRVADGLRERVRFQAHNLASWDYPLPRDGAAWDLIVCRNVVIYFDGATTARVVRRFYDCLVEGGTLCLGYSESLFRLDSDFELVEVGGAFVYRRPATAAKGRAARSAAAAAPGEAVVLGPAKRGGAAPPPARSAARAAMALEAPERVRRVGQMLDRGDFDGAVRALRQGLEQNPASLPLLITLGNTLTVLGRIAEARDAYRAALHAEPLCAEAHLFLGIALFEAGDGAREGAAEELRRALFLDPELAWAHYYLARIAELANDRAGARRGYRNAIAASRAAPRVFLGHYPDLPADPAALARAASWALAALEG